MQGRMRVTAMCLALLLLCTALAGCGQQASQESVVQSSVEITETETGGDQIIEEEMVALAEAPAVDVDLTPVASGKLVQKNTKASIDYSNTTDGYVMVKYSAASTKKIKAQVTGPTTTYTYNLDAGAADWTVFPLSDGNGAYKVTVFENVTGTKYSTVLSVSFQVTLKNEFAPFLRSNQYVNYTNAINTKAKAKELCSGKKDELEKVKAVYDYVVTNFTYDKTKAANVKSGYLPVLDTVLSTKKAICFDYAAVMTAMLRCEGIPCKLVVGYAGTAYHAWISVYSQENGWMDGAIYFDGADWKRMDPTFASSGKQSKEIMKYIGDGSHYTVKYLY